MSARTEALPFDAIHSTTETQTLRRFALWALLVSKIITGWGVQWDIQWHVLIGRDSFWIPPHLMTYAGVSATVLISFGVLAWETWHGTGPVRMLGFSGTRGFHLAAWGIALTVLAAPIDDLWHRIFGIDVTLWSPPHLLGILGASISALACLVIAREVYHERNGARMVAMMVAGAVLYGSIHLVVDPSFRVAYLHGGILFYTYAMLTAMLLPLALVPAARLAANRWTPVLVLIVVTAMGMAGQRIARIGFEAMKPVSVIEEEIAKDPTSPIAVATIMARKNKVTPGRVGGWPLMVLGLGPVLAMALVDVRRRPVAATIAYGIVLFGAAAWFLPARPALADMAPGPGPTAVAFVLTIAAAWVGGMAGRRLSDGL